MLRQRHEFFRRDCGGFEEQATMVRPTCCWPATHVVVAQHAALYFQRVVSWTAESRPMPLAAHIRVWWSVSRRRIPPRQYLGWADIGASPRRGIQLAAPV